VNVAVTLIQSQRPPAERQRNDLTRVAALVLTAGSSTRFGEPKQFALFQGKTFIKRIVTAAIEADCAPVVVVTGEDSTQVTSELTRLSVSIAMNSGWSSGGGISIRVGVQRAMDLAADLDASLLLSCDQPFVTAAVLAQLIQFAPNQWETDRRVSLRHDARNSRSL
jgi:molybdenum cofactor cytidylyltransferase